MTSLGRRWPTAISSASSSSSARRLLALAQPTILRLKASRTSCLFSRRNAPIRRVQAHRGPQPPPRVGPLSDWPWQPRPGSTDQSVQTLAQARRGHARHVATELREIRRSRCRHQVHLWSKSQGVHQTGSIQIPIPVQFYVAELAGENAGAMATGAVVGPGANPLGPSGGRKLVKDERAMRQRRSA